ncbi:unnamed protein product [Urochloa humidicola]
MSAAPAYDRTAELRALDATLASVRGLVASGTTHVPRIFHLPDPDTEEQQQLRAEEQQPSPAATARRWRTPSAVPRRSGGSSR